MEYTASVRVRGTLRRGEIVNIKKEGDRYRIMLFFRNLQQFYTFDSDVLVYIYDKDSIRIQFDKLLLIKELYPTDESPAESDDCCCSQ
jgi:hypothetical protein